MARTDLRSMHVRLNGTGFLLATEPQMGEGRRAYERTKKPKPTFRVEAHNVQPSPDNPDALTVLFDDFSGGWGEGRYITPNRYSNARNVDLRNRGQAFLAPDYTYVSLASKGWTAPDTAPRNFYELPADTGNLYFTWGVNVVRINVATPTVANCTSALSLGTGNVASQVAVFDGYGWIARYTTASGAAQPVIRHLNNTTSDTHADANAAFDGIVAGADSLGACLYATKRYATTTGGRTVDLTRLEKLYTGRNGMNNPYDADGFWFSNISFGEPGQLFRWLVRYGYQIFGACPTGVYSFDEFLNTPNVVPEMQFYANTTNGYQSQTINAALWIPHILGLAMYDGAVWYIGPVNGTTVLTDPNGRRWGYCTAQASANGEHYAAFWNGTDSLLFAGRKTERAMIWHSLSYFSGEGPFTTMAVTGLTDPPRLFLGQMKDNPAFVWMELPRATNHLQDPRTFYTTGTGKATAQFDTQFHHCGYPGVSKGLEEVIIEGDQLTSTELLTIQVRMSETGAWTSLGNVTSSPMILRPTTTLSGQGLQFRIQLARGSTGTLTPILRSLQARVILRRKEAQVWNLALQIGDYQFDTQGNVRARSAKTLRDALTALEPADSGDVPTFTFVDPYGVSHTCTLLGRARFTEVAKPAQESPIEIAQVSVCEVGV